jgi:hypothetical protein
VRDPVPLHKPPGLKYPFIGVATDLFAYAVIIPVIPFRLESLGYTDASARTGWLLFAYSGGLAISTPPIACVYNSFTRLNRCQMAKLSS